VITQSGLGYNEQQACSVLNKEYPTICTCDPRSCSGPVSPTTSPAPASNNVSSLAPSLAGATRSGPSSSMGPVLTTGPSTAPSNSSQGVLAAQMKEILLKQGAYNNNDGSGSSAAVAVFSTAALLGSLLAGLIQ
jgi:hypothetical protein